MGGHAAAASVRWGCLIGFAVVLGILVLGQLAGARVARVFLGQDRRLSTSKSIAAVWTIVVAALLFAMVWANLFDHPQALKATGAAGVIGQYAVLFGGPLGAAILAKQIVTTQVNADPGLKPAGSASPKDLIANDVGNADLDVGKKALVPTDTITATFDSNTVKGHVGDTVRIVLTGLASSRQHISAWVRFDDSEKGQVVVVAAPVAGGEATLSRCGAYGLDRLRACAVSRGGG